MLTSGSGGQVIAANQAAFAERKLRDIDRSARGFYCKRVIVALCLANGPSCRHQFRR